MISFCTYRLLLAHISEAQEKYKVLHNQANIIIIYCKQMSYRIFKITEFENIRAVISLYQGIQIVIQKTVFDYNKMYENIIIQLIQMHSLLIK